MSISVKTTEGEVVVEDAHTWMVDYGCLKLFGKKPDGDKAILQEFAVGYWQAVKAGNGAVAIPPAAAPAAPAPVPTATVAPESAANAAWAERRCARCAKLGLKTNKGYPPRLYVNDKVGLQCNGLNAEGEYQNHSLNGYAAGAYAGILG